MHCFNLWKIWSCIFTLSLPNFPKKTRFFNPLTFNILIEIPCNNSQNVTLVHAHKPKFGPFFFIFLFFFAKTVPNFLLLLFPLFFFLLSYPRSFLLSTSFLLAGKVWTKSSVNPEKGTLISSRFVGLFMHRFCTKKGAFFFD